MRPRRNTSYVNLQEKGFTGNALLRGGDVLERPEGECERTREEEVRFIKKEAIVWVNPKRPQSVQNAFCTNWGFLIHDS